LTVSVVVVVFGFAPGAVSTIVTVTLSDLAGFTSFFPDAVSFSARARERETRSCFVFCRCDQPEIPIFDVAWSRTS
jgi:hypothetical protein